MESPIVDTIPEALIDDTISGKDERLVSNLKLPTLSKRAIRNACTCFYLRTYRGHRPMGNVLLQTSRYHVRARLWLRRLLKRVFSVPFVRRFYWKVVKRTTAY